jgi:thymidylate synthase
MAAQDLEYNRVVNAIEREGVDKGDRTGTGTRSLFGTRMEFDLSNKKVPLLTTKKVFTKGIIHELVWMLSGDTNIRYLKENGVDIWDSWIDPDTAEYVDLTFEEREAIADKLMGNISTYRNVVQRMKETAGEDINTFKDLMSDYWLNNDVPSRKLVAGELNDIYQKQWRRWDDTRVVSAKKAEALMKKGFNYLGTLPGRTDCCVVRREIDQIQNVIDRLKSNPDCRRIIVSAWNVGEIDGMSLPPCHAFFQFWTRELEKAERYALLANNVRWADDMSLDIHELCDIHNIPKRALHCQLYQRSCDTSLGVPFNIVQYSLLTHMIAQCVGMVAERFVWVGGDTHIYRGHEEGIREQKSRQMLEATAWVELNPEVTDIFAFTADDIVIKDYQSHPAIKFPKAAV